MSPKSETGVAQSSAVSWSLRFNINSSISRRMASSRTCVCVRTAASWGSNSSRIFLPVFTMSMGLMPVYPKRAIALANAALASSSTGATGNSVSSRSNVSRPRVALAAGVAAVPLTVALLSAAVDLTATCCRSASAGTLGTANGLANPTRRAKDSDVDTGTFNCMIGFKLLWLVFERSCWS